MDNNTEQLERELRGMQEMLFFVLQAVGTPVEVSKAALKAGANDQMINVEDTEGVFIFSIVEVPSEV